MKDSGIPWLGEVPAHWEIRPIKSLGVLKGGAGFPDAEQGLTGEELGFYKVASLGRADATDFLLLPEHTISRETANRLGAYIFPEGSIVFAKVGAALMLGRIRCLPAPACIDNNMMGMLVAPDNDVGFVKWAMSLVNFDLIANPGAVPSLNASQIGNYQLAKPKREEQVAISEFIQTETERLRRLQDEAQHVIHLLKERRDALISAAVTGKIDVRHVA
jgi:type I restriction enzyme S subunit